MEIDITKKILKDFGLDAERATTLLADFEQRSKLSPRVSRCIVHLANGDISKLVKTIKEAEVDWRDVVIVAETTDFEFNKPFKQT